MVGIYAASMISAFWESVKPDNVSHKALSPVTASPTTRPAETVPPVQLLKYFSRSTYSRHYGLTWKLRLVMYCLTGCLKTVRLVANNHKRAECARSFFTRRKREWVRWGGQPWYQEGAGPQAWLDRPVTDRCVIWASVVGHAQGNFSRWNTERKLEKEPFLNLCFAYLLISDYILES